jgi:hypothetical protein
MNCPNCNNFVREGRNFCGHCGYELKPEARESAPPVPDQFDEDAPTTLAPMEGVEQEPAILTREKTSTVEDPSPKPDSSRPMITVDSVHDRSMPPSASTPEKPKRRIPGWVWLLLSIFGILAILGFSYAIYQYSQLNRTSATSDPAAVAQAVDRTLTAQSIAQVNSQETSQPAVNRTATPRPNTRPTNTARPTTRPPTSTPVSQSNPPTATAPNLLETCPPIITVNQATNCREGPSQTYKHAADVVPGDEPFLTLIGRNKNVPQWWYLETSKYEYNISCWVSHVSIDLEGDTSCLPVISLPPTPTP